MSTPTYRLYSERIIQADLVKASSNFGLHGFLSIGFSFTETKGISTTCLGCKSFVHYIGDRILHNSLHFRDVHMLIAKLRI